MVTVTEASTIVLSHIPALAAEELLLEEAMGRSLAEGVTSDRDLPPINRATMDGIAISFDAWQGGTTSYRVEGTLAAGQQPVALIKAGHCIEIMTGAAVPSGADAVIPYEHVRLEGNNACVEAKEVRRGQNIHARGSDALKGTHLLGPGTLISPAEVALLAAVGKQKVRVFKFPSTAVVSTGDELVSIDQTPAPYQVRRSNSYAILAAMKGMGWRGDSFHLPDNKDVVESQLDVILKTYDTVIISGGVSKGKFDFIPQALERNGIVKRFHRVNQRPGKPFWFGTSGDGKRTVFALPGNPVSTYLCFYRYVKHWIQKSLHIADDLSYAVLASDFQPPSGMTYFLQVAVTNERGVLTAYPHVGGGSGDFANLKEVTGFLEISDTTTAKKGDAFPYFPFR